jgi:hypothetical protein
MNLDFIQGAVWTCLFLGTWNFMIRPNLKPALFLKLIQIFIDTVKKSNPSMNVKQEGNLLKVEMLDNTVYLPTYSSNHMYDIVCYQDSEHKIKIPITFFQYKDKYVYIPFKPRDFALPNVYVGIKFLTKDNFIYFTVNQDEFVDIPELTIRYAAELETMEASQELAEAYDED